MTDVYAEIAIGILSGFIAGLLAVWAQRVGQWLIDNALPFPYRVVVAGLKPNWSLRRCEVRVRNFNRTSTETKFYPGLRNGDGNPINGTDVQSLWKENILGNWVIVPPRSWTEFRIQAPVQEERVLPKTLRLNAHVFSTVIAKEKDYPIKFTFE